MSATAWPSVRSDFRNFSRAGVALNRSRNSTWVPRVRAAGRNPSLRPPFTVIAAPSAPAARDCSVRRPTAASDGRRLARKPKEWMFSRSVPSILEVAWRARASGSSPARSCRGRRPSTRISARPPSRDRPRRCGSPRRRARSPPVPSRPRPAVSTTSPAAMRSMARGSSGRTGGDDGAGLGHAPKTTRAPRVLQGARVRSAGSCALRAYAASAGSGASAGASAGTSIRSRRGGLRRGVALQSLRLAHHHDVQRAFGVHQLGRPRAWMSVHASPRSM